MVSNFSLNFSNKANFPIVMIARDRCVCVCMCSVNQEVNFDFPAFDSWSMFAFCDFGKQIVWIETLCVCVTPQSRCSFFSCCVSVPHKTERGLDPCLFTVFTSNESRFPMRDPEGFNLWLMLFINQPN